MSGQPTPPRKLNLGSGKDFRDDCLNVDCLERWSPDVIADLNVPFPGGNGAFDTVRFGRVELHPGSVERIFTIDLLEHIEQLPTLMTSCLDLLEVDGVMEVYVPYDLSYGAWQDPTHVRAFNERSWTYYSEWFWYLGWSEARFEVDALEFAISDIGKRLRADGMDSAAILRAPRAVDAMHVLLRKVLLSQADRDALARFTQSGAR